MEPGCVERGGGLHASLRDPHGMRILPNCEIEWRRPAEDNETAAVRSFFSLEENAWRVS